MAENISSAARNAPNDINKKRNDELFQKLPMLEPLYTDANGSAVLNAAGKADVNIFGFSRFCETVVVGFSFN